MTSIPAMVLIAPIRFYQRLITPYTPATCRYYPTCSAYAVTALRTHGAAIGTGLTIWRLLRCNPWSSGGVDKVPAKGQLWHRHASAQAHAGEVCGEPGERDAAAASSSPVDPNPLDPAPADPAEHCSVGADLDAPQTAAPEPMIGRSAA